MAPRIEVLCREEMAAYHCLDPWAGISITTDAGDWPEVDRQNCRGLLRLCFADLEEPHPGETLFSQADAAQILTFVHEMWTQVDVLVIHCRAGLRRSPAVAAAITRIYFGDDAAWFRPGVYDPNMLVYETLLNVARQRGEFTAPRNPRRKRRGGKGSRPAS